jgi:hypothetical protein
VENQEKRVLKYLADEYASRGKRTEQAEGRVARAKAAGRTSPFGPARTWRYSPTKAILKVEFGGQQLKIFEWFVNHKDGGTTKEIAAGMEAAGFKPGKQPTEKVVAFYMNDWLKREYVKREEVAPDAPAPEA